MSEAQASYDTATTTEATEATEPTPAEALMAECRALLERIAQTTGVPIVQAQETAPVNVRAATAKGPDGKDVPALVIQMDAAQLQMAALYTLMSHAGAFTSDAFDLAVLTAKRDTLASMADKMDAAAQEAKANAAKASSPQLTVATRGPLVLPNGQPVASMPNRAARRSGGGRGNLTRIRND